MILTDEEFFALPPVQGPKAEPPATQEGQPPVASDQLNPAKGIMSEEEFMGQLTPESQKKVKEFTESNARGKAAFRGAAQGFTLGYEPELLGGQLYQQFANPNPAWAFGLGSPPDLSDVPKQAQEITEAERKANEKAQTEHPLPFFAGNVAGSALNPMLNAAKPSVTSGAIIGGVSGASEGKTPTERLKNAAEGVVSGGALSGMLKNIGHPDQAEIDQIVREAKELGIDVPRYMANPNLFMQSTANIMRNIPVAGGPIEKSARKFSQQMGTAADNLGGVDPEFAGRIFGDNIKNWVTKTSKETVSQAYDKVSGLMDPKVLTPLEKTGDLIAKLAADNVEAAKEGSSGAIKMVLPAVQRSEGLTYKGLKDLRTSIGEKLDNPSLLPADISQAELKRIYGALTADLNAAAKNAGGDAGALAHQKANALADQVADQRTSLVSLLGGPQAGASNENIFANLVAAASKSPGSADMELLKLARGTIPRDEWDKAVSGVISQMGRDADGNFSPTRFLGPNGYNKLSDAGKDALFGAVGSSKTRDNLETMADVSRQFADYMKYANPSGTTHGVVGYETLKDLVKNPFNILAGLVGGRQLSKMISEPSTSSAMADWSRAYVKAFPSSPIGSTLGLAQEAAVKGSVGALKAATRNLATVNAKQTGEDIAGVTRFLWVPIAQSLGLKGEDADIRRASGGRTGRATGGAVNLMALSKAAKKHVTQSTEDLLNESDDTVTRALEIANQHI